MPKDNEVDEKVMRPTDEPAKTVARYNINYVGMPQGVHYSTEGDWVKYSAHASTVAELRAEVETCRKLLAEKVTAETLLRELHITPAGMAMQVEGGMAGVIAQCLVDQFHDIGGPNFFEMKFSADQQQYVLTVQRYGGLTPADKMKAAQQRADAAERRVGELENLLGAWYAEESRYGARLQAPGHHHQVPGIWDSDNGPIAGKPCAKCALWQQIRSITGADPT